MDKEAGSQEQNPLLTYLVLETLFRKLGFGDLQSCRLVCKAWKSVSSPALGELSLIKLCSPGSLRAYMGDQAETTSFLNYSIKLVESEGEESERLFAQFWQANRVSIKELSLDLSPNVAGRVMERIFRQTDPESPPSLESLKVRILKFFSNHNSEEAAPNSSAMSATRLKAFEYVNYTFDRTELRFPLSWADFLLKAPRLKSLLLTGISESELTQILSQIKGIRTQNKGLLNLKTLQILSDHAAPESPTTEHLSSLIDLDLGSLESLGLEIGPQIEFSVLEALLAKYCGSLRALLLRRYPFTGPGLTFSTDFNALTQLDISDGLVSDLRFLAYFPALRSLQVSIRDYSRLTNTELFARTSALRPQAHVVSLTLEPLLSLECLRKLIKWFPGLVELKLRADDVMARLIFTNLTRLTSLHLIAHLRVDNYNLVRVTLSDEGLTGIPLPVLKAGRVDPRRDRIMSYIGNLQELRSLTIESWHDYGNGITDFSICYGLLDLPRLENVRLERTLISSQGFQLLSAHSKSVSQS